MSKLSYLSNDFLSSHDARPIRILSEYLFPKSEFEKQGLTDTIVMFGSSRIPSPEKAGVGSTSPIARFYDEAMEFSRLVTDWGQNLPLPGRKLMVCTGGGPGIMEAGNRGAQKTGGKSISLNIILPHEQSVNPYATKELSFEFRYFFMRKFWFLRHCRGLVAFPGGFGTMDELFEVLTLVQTGKTKQIPVILYGKEFWTKLWNFELLVDYGLISEKDRTIFTYADSPEEAFSILQKSIEFRT